MEPAAAIRPATAFLEEERFDSGEVGRVATVLLRGARCPFDCLMCDLGEGMLPGPTPAGSLPLQIDAALSELAADPSPPPRHLKLYNAGSFFDRVAVPPVDLPAIAARARRFERLIVECHPSLVGESAVGFRALLGDTSLEVAMGLETIHPEVLPRLDKRMTAEDFRDAGRTLLDNRIQVRAFILLGLPFVEARESVLWAENSVEFAFDCGVSVVSVIPTRSRKGAMRRLLAEALFTPPTIGMLEEVTAYGIALGRGRVFADLWDLERFSTCPSCVEDRRKRFDRMNRTQEVGPLLHCPACRQ